MLGQHLDELLDPARPGFRLLGVLHPVEDRVPVLAVESREKLGCGGAGRQGHREVFGHSGGLRPSVGGIPATVRLCALDLRHPRRPHPPLLDKSAGFLPVDLGPLAARRAGGESLEPAGVVELVLLAVDPAIGQCHVESLSVVKAVRAAVLLAELQPDPPTDGMVRRDPLFKGRSRPELDDLFLASHVVSESQDARRGSVSRYSSDSGPPCHARATHQAE